MQDLKLYEMLIPLVVAAITSGLCTMWLIPYLSGLKAKQPLHVDIPDSHKKKVGTPTMGGLGILAGLFAGALVIITIKGASMPLLIIVAATGLYGAIGFLDDYKKISTKKNMGLNARQKLVLQIVFALVIGLYYVFVADLGTDILIPFIWKNINISYFMVVYIAFVIVAMVNSVNLTDGLDGLASGVTCVISLFFPTIIILGLTLSAKSIGLAFFASALIAPQAEALFFSAIAGACIGFLIYNRHPAKIFMGDTGSLALGAAIATAAIFTHMELILVIVGFVYVAEALSDILQVLYFKRTGGKRIFKMAPIHHHFEMSGWAETKVVSRFVTFTLILCLLTVGILYAQNIFG